MVENDVNQPTRIGEKVFELTATRARTSLTGNDNLLLADSRVITDKFGNGHGVCHVKLVGRFGNNIIEHIILYIVCELWMV